MIVSSKSILKELDEAVQRGSAESREKALWYATNMLMIGSYSDEEIWTFGEIIGARSKAPHARAWPSGWSRRIALR